MCEDILRYRGIITNNAGQQTVIHSQHQTACTDRANDFARSMRDMLTGWTQYARAHRDRYESGIGEDYVVGLYWAETGLAINRLLDGDTGGLDCGSLANNITDAIEAEGFKTDGYSLIDDDSSSNHIMVGTCPRCDGTRTEPGIWYPPSKCFMCGGSGRVRITPVMR